MSRYLAAFVLIVAGLPAFADVVYFDTDFDNSDWDVFPLESSNIPGTSMNLSSWQSNGTSRTMNFLFNAVPQGRTIYDRTFHVKLNSYYFPSIDGAIDSIDFQYDLLWTSVRNPTPNMDGGLYHPAVLQDGKVYIPSSHTGDHATTMYWWTNYTHTGLRASDLSPVSTLAQPDFSASGAPLAFGFVTYFEASCGAFEAAPCAPGGGNTVSDLDNFSVTIHSVAATPAAETPEPATLLPATGALVAAAFWQRRRRGRQLATVNVTSYDTVNGAATLRPGGDAASRGMA